jgi:hypothetical protein
MYLRDVIFTKRENQCRLIKDGEYYIINTHKGKSNISLVSVNQAQNINSSKNYEFIFIREKHLGDESIRVKESLEGCTKEHKLQLDELLKV